MSEDRHADERDRKRRAKRYGHTTTNRGLRIVMRDLARRSQGPDDGPKVSPSSSPGRRRVRIKRRRKRRG